jgi:hypothetical protein
VTIGAQKSDLTAPLTVIDPIACRHNRDYRHGRGAYDGSFLSSNDLKIHTFFDLWRAEIA